jgi:hypothetical protein
MSLRRTRTHATHRARKPLRHNPPKFFNMAMAATGTVARLAVCTS